MTEHVDVLIVGAGLSGIGAAHRLQRQCPGVNFMILEGRDAMGGTWDLFRYPGIRSDSDMYTMGYDFKPWRGGKVLADGPSIKAYIEETAAEAGIESRVRFGHQVISADWSTESASWRMEQIVILRRWTWTSPSRCNLPKSRVTLSRVLPMILARSWWESRIPSSI